MKTNVTLTQYSKETETLGVQGDEFDGEEDHKTEKPPQRWEHFIFSYLFIDYFIYLGEREREKQRERPPLRWLALFEAECAYMRVYVCVERERKRDTWHIQTHDDSHERPRQRRECQSRSMRKRDRQTDTRHSHSHEKLDRGSERLRESNSRSANDRPHEGERHTALRAGERGSERERARERVCMCVCV
jgi:hypothetical protein